MMDQVKLLVALIGMLGFLLASLQVFFVPIEQTKWTNIRLASAMLFAILSALLYIAEAFPGLVQQYGFITIVVMILVGLTIVLFFLVKSIQLLIHYRMEWAGPLIPLGGWIIYVLVSLFMKHQ